MPVGHDSQSIAKREFRSGHSTQNEANAAGLAGAVRREFPQDFAGTTEDALRIRDANSMSDEGVVRFSHQST
jgi:hypothetical protein